MKELMTLFHAKQPSSKQKHTIETYTTLNNLIKKKNQPVQMQ